MPKNYFRDFFVDINKTRIANLKVLVKGYSRIEFAKKIGYQNTNYLNQLLIGAGSFGNTTARKIEKNLGLPEGALDDSSIHGNENLRLKQFELYRCYESSSETTQQAVRTLLGFEINSDS